MSLADGSRLIAVVSGEHVLRQPFSDYYDLTDAGLHLKVSGGLWGVLAEASFFGRTPYDVSDGGLHLKVFGGFWGVHAEATFFGLTPDDVSDAGLHLKVPGGF